ncbi:sugar phosphate isomerase/epimerase family protein [Paenibacillus aurantius]|uniref:Sugar phosphate isomerase/epimerase family protein n=1 Tax=Paenibacillus aurantius TaxID=2918900 RepID=A0AA96LML6_9BACL|nr:sugar phosphate isomerase/epimerase family protein [Paenibacillus aurantius]WNQ13967.1 sugar phosphate isomerase/epimerase family protein [Paenibacillus aurantius]
MAGGSKLALTFDNNSLDGWQLGMSYNAAKPLDLSSLADNGIRCMELNWRELDIFTPENRRTCTRIVNEARNAGISVWSLHIPFGVEWDLSSLDAQVREAAHGKIAWVIELASEWGIPNAVLHPSYEPIRPEERQSRLEVCRQSLNRLTEQVERLHLTLAIECLPRTCLGHSSTEIRYLLEGNPALNVCCDVNHLFKESPESFIRELGSRIVTTHISDNDGVDEKHWLPGSGVIQWPNVFRSFQETRYRGPMIFEVRNQTAEQVSACWKGLEAIDW